MNVVEKKQRGPIPAHLKRWSCLLKFIEQSASTISSFPAGCRRLIFFSISVNSSFRVRVSKYVMHGYSSVSQTKP